MERMKVLSEESNYENLKNRVATFITAVNEWLDQNESKLSENIEIETEFPHKRIRKVKKQPGEETSDDKCNWSPYKNY
jgi:predicted RecB family endonuclease